MNHHIIAMGLASDGLAGAGPRQRQRAEGQTSELKQQGPTASKPQAATHRQMCSRQSDKSSRLAEPSNQSKVAGQRAEQNVSQRGMGNVQAPRRSGINPGPFILERSVALRGSGGTFQQERVPDQSVTRLWTGRVLGEAS